MHPTRPITHRHRPPRPVPAGAVPPPLAAGGDPWREQLSAARILSERFFSPQTSFFTGRPVAALMRAVLEYAMACFQCQRVTEGRQVHREAQEADAWFWSDDSDRPFAFVTVCSVLGLEPEAIRHQLKRWRHSHSAMPQRKIQRDAVRPLHRGTRRLP